MKGGWAFHLGAAQETKHWEGLRRKEMLFLKEIEKEQCKSREKNNAETCPVLLKKQNL